MLVERVNDTHQKKEEFKSELVGAKRENAKIDRERNFFKDSVLAADAQMGAMLKERG